MSETNSDKIEISKKELSEYIKRIEALPWADSDKRKLIGFISKVSKALFLLQEKKISISRLRNMLFGWKTEKRRKKKQKENFSLEDKKEKAKGHGKNGVEKYTGAKREYLFIEKLTKGDTCPCCLKSKLYEIESGVTLKLSGNAPVDATIYEKQKLRCPSCGETFTAELPNGVTEERFDSTATAAIATMRYGYGIPFYRLEQLQSGTGVPLPSSTQWDEVEKLAGSVYPVWRELIKYAAQGEIIHNDDTTIKILSLMSLEDRERKGMFTTGIVSKTGGREILLFFSGWRHAGENINSLLENRKSGLDPPIQMCDALSRNLPADFKTIEVNCNAHGRRSTPRSAYH